MKLYILFLAGLITAQNTTETTTAPPPPPVVTTVAPAVETTTAPEKITTAAPIITTPSDSPTTAPTPATTTAETVTTTPAPVTTTPASVTTTPAPVTTGQPDPVTTPAPEPVTTPGPTPADDGIRRLPASVNGSCIMVKFEASLQVDNDTLSIFSNETTVDVDQSSCIVDDQGVVVLTKSDTTIKFDLSSTTVPEGVKNVTTWRIDDIALTTKANGAMKTVDLKAESIHGGSSYSCLTGFTANLTDDVVNSTNVIGTITMSGFWVEVAIGEEFPIDDDKRFAKAESCAADTEESLLVPIVVACALAGLVLAICVAYIIGRRRTYSGYSAM